MTDLNRLDPAALSAAMRGGTSGWGQIEKAARDAFDATMERHDAHRDVIEDLWREQRSAWIMTTRAVVRFLAESAEVESERVNRDLGSSHAERMKPHYSARWLRMLLEERDEG